MEKSDSEGKRKESAGCNTMTPVPAEVIEPLLEWYVSHARPLPWRVDGSPYHVWLSEIMLQQTRVEAVIPYYERFVAELPDIRSLAAVEDDRLMKLWEGLGYYSRARNLKKAAQMILEQYGGRMPADYQSLLRLPGVGAYTAGAIASIAFGLPEPAVDGNVLRVLMRLTGDDSDIMKSVTRERVSADLRRIYPAGAAASAMTQGLMELGQTVCIPNGIPRCSECPWGVFCRARTRNLIDVLPVRSKKLPRITVERTVILLYCEGEVAIRKRASGGLLAGLWEFPGRELFLTAEETEQILRGDGYAVARVEKAIEAVHIFTHREWHMRSYWVELSEKPAKEDLVWVPETVLDEQYALPSAFRSFRSYLRTRSESRQQRNESEGQVEGEK